jgi:uncharacterized membrane protein (UPF0127 family)
MKGDFKFSFFNFQCLLELIILLMIVIYILTSKTSQSPTKLRIGNKVTIKLIVANSEEKKIQGYSKQPPIDYQQGMLFVYQSPGFSSFWMREMLFNLDFIFIRQNRIVDLVENVKNPKDNHGQIEFVNSRQAFDQALEVKAGFIKKYQVRINDPVQIDP